MPKQKTAVAKLRETISKTYTDNVPQWADRIVSLIPAAGILGYAYYNHGETFDGKKYDISSVNGKGIGIPLGLGIYAASQVGISFAEQYTDSIANPTVQKTIKFFTGLLDAVNDAFVISPALNMLPAGGINSTFAINMLPNYFKGIEADIRSVIKGEGLDGYYAGNIFPSAAAGALKNIVLQAGIEKSDVKGKIGAEASSITTAIAKQFVYNISFMAMTGKTFAKGEYVSDMFKSVAMSHVYSANLGFKNCSLDNKIVGVDDNSVFNGLTTAVVIESGAYILTQVCKLMESEETVDAMETALEPTALQTADMFE